MACYKTQNGNNNRNGMKWNKWISYNTANPEELIKSNGLSLIFNKLSNTCIATRLAGKCTIYQNFKGENFHEFHVSIAICKVLPSKC